VPIINGELRKGSSQKGCPTRANGRVGDKDIVWPNTKETQKELREEGWVTSDKEEGVITSLQVGPLKGGDRELL
jgi:hypothetical protein